MPAQVLGQADIQDTQRLAGPPRGAPGIVSAGGKMGLNSVRTTVKEGWLMTLWSNMVWISGF